MNIFLSSLTMLEIFLFLCTIFLILKRHNYSLTDSMTFAAVLVLSSYSGLIQTFFIIRSIKYFLIVDIFIVSLSLFVISKHYNIIFLSISNIHNFIIKYKSLFTIFLFFIFYLFLQALLLPPTSWDCLSYNLPRIFMMQRDNSLFVNYFNDINQVTLFVGADVLHFLFLRLHSDLFSGVFSFLSYIILCTSTFSLVRHYFNNEKLSLTTAIIIGSLVEIVLQSTSGKNDLILAALAASSFLAAYKFIYLRDLFCGFILLTCLIFGISIKAYFLGFAIPFIFLFLIFYWKEFLGFSKNYQQKFNRKYLFLIVLPGLILLCFFIFISHNFVEYGSFWGDLTQVMEHTNKDGLKGAASNGLRYWLQSLGWPSQFGDKIIDKIHDYFLGESKNLGIASKFSPKITLSLSIFQLPHEYTSWYGPFAFFLIFPAIFYAVIRGPKFVRLVSLSLFSFYFSVCYVIGWMFCNNRFFSLFFGGSGICVAFFITRIKKRNFMKCLILSSFFILMYSTFLNMDKPIVNIHKIAEYIHNNIVHIDKMENKNFDLSKAYYGYDFFNWVYFIIHREDIYNRYFQDNRLELFDKIIKSNSSVLIVGNDEITILPFFFKRSDLCIVNTKLDNFRFNGKDINFLDCCDVSFVIKKFPYIIFINCEPSPCLKSSNLILQFFRRKNLAGKKVGESFFLYDYTSTSDKKNYLSSLRSR